MSVFKINDIIVTNCNEVIQLTRGWQQREFNVVRHATLQEKQKFYRDIITRAQKDLEKLTNIYPKKTGNDYFFLSGIQLIDREEDLDSEVDQLRYEIGNYYHLNDFKSAQQEAAHHKFEKQVAMFIKQREGKTLYPEEGILGFTFVILPFDNKVFTTNSLLPRCRGWLASTEETILDAIKHFGSDKFIKWQLGKL